MGEAEADTDPALVEVWLTADCGRLDKAELARARRLRRYVAEEGRYVAEGGREPDTAMLEPVKLEEEE